MYPSTGDRLMSQHCNQNGFHYIKPDIDPRLAPAIVEVPFSGGINLCNTSNGDVYQHMDWVPSSTVVNNVALTHVAAPNQNLQLQNMTTYTAAWRAPTSNNTFVDQSRWPTRSGISLDLTNQCRNTSIQQSSDWSATANAGWNQSYDMSVVRTGPYQTALSSWTKYNFRQGVRVIPAHELRQMEMPETPTKFNADPQFNDGLWMSLQGDVLPSGANPLDDYMHNHRDCRARIYIDATIGNQGCPCECDMTNLDKYLTRNTDISSAIALRATLSEERRQQVQEPSDSKILKDYAQAFKGQAEQLLKAAQNLFNKPEQGKTNPWDARDEDESTMIL